MEKMISGIAGQTICYKCNEWHFPNDNHIRYVCPFSQKIVETHKKDGDCKCGCGHSTDGAMYFSPLIGN